MDIDRSGLVLLFCSSSSICDLVSMQQTLGTNYVHILFMLGQILERERAQAHDYVQNHTMVLIHFVFLEFSSRGKYYFSLVCMDPIILIPVLFSSKPKTLRNSADNTLLTRLVKTQEGCFCLGRIRSSMAILIFSSTAFISFIQQFPSTIWRHPLPSSHLSCSFLPLDPSGDMEASYLRSMR